MAATVAPAPPTPSEPCPPAWFWGWIVAASATFQPQFPQWRDPAPERGTGREEGRGAGRWATVGEGKKRSAPGRAASRSRRAARGDSLRWGDPPLIDLPALAFPSTNVIARRSVSPGGRSRFRRSPLSRLPGSGSFGECRFHLPGCPDRLPRRAVSTSPVARIGFPSCRFRLPGCPDRLPRRGQLALPGCPVRPPRPGRFRLPGCPDRRPRPVVTLPQTPGFPGTQCGCAPTADHLPYLPRFHLVRPVGPPPRPPLPCG